MDRYICKSIEIWRKRYKNWGEREISVLFFCPMVRLESFIRNVFVNSHWPHLVCRLGHCSRLSSYINNFTDPFHFEVRKFWCRSPMLIKYSQELSGKTVNVRNESTTIWRIYREKQAASWYRLCYFRRITWWL